MKPSLAKAQVGLAQLGSTQVQESAHSHAYQCLTQTPWGTVISDCLLRTCDWRRTWPSEACRFQEAFGESSKKQESTDVDS